MVYLGILDAPPAGYRRMRCLISQPGNCEVWARGSMFSPTFSWCHVRKEGE